MTSKKVNIVEIVSIDPLRTKKINNILKLFNLPWKLSK